MPDPIPPSERALIDAHIAQHGVTRCPRGASAFDPITGLTPTGKAIDGIGVYLKDRRCTRCGTEFKGRYNALYCGDECRRAGQNAKKRKRKR